MPVNSYDNLTIDQIRHVAQGEEEFADGVTADYIAVLCDHIQRLERRIDSNRRTISQLINGQRPCS